MRASRILSCAAALLLASANAAPAGPRYQRSALLPPITGAAPGVAPHGINGLNFGPDGALYTASLIGPGIHRVDVTRGTLVEVVGAPQGEADDIAAGPDGTLAWTALIAGELRVRRPDGRVDTLATDLPLFNPVHFTADGRLFPFQRCQPDALLEFDPDGRKPPRTNASGLGGINAFTDDGRGNLYVPLAARGAIGRVDIASGALTVLASGLGEPVAVKRDSKGGLATIDWQSGRVIHVDPVTGATRTIAIVTPPLDNLAIGPDDTIYVSRPSDNSIVAIDPSTGAQRPLIQGALAAPGGLALMQRAGRPTLLVSDAMGYRFVDASTGAVEMLPFDLLSNASSSVAVTTKTLVLGYVRRPQVTVIERASGRVLQSFKGFKAPMGVVALEDGTIFVADFGSGEILRLAPGQQPDRAVLSSGLQGPTGLVLDPRGGLIVSEASSGRLLHVDLASGEQRVIARGLAQPEGIAMLPGGDIAVAEVGARRLTRVTFARGRDEGRPQPIARDLPIGQMFTRAPAPVYLPTGVAAGADGTIYVVCDVDDTILKFTPRR